MQFQPASADQLLALRVNAGIDALVPGEEGDDGMIAAIVDAVGSFAQGTFAPLNRIGDTEGARIENGRVVLPEGFAQAYREYVDAGWNAIAAPAEYGGQGLPFTLGCCVLENLGSANMAFTLLPMLTLGAIDALVHHGSEAQKELYLPRMATGQWSGTMNLTEPQAGSDLGALRASAEPIETGEHAGKYRITGGKIFITWGEHDLAENVIHLVLARLPGAPAGSRGISLFLVPKYLVDAEGTIGPRNGVRVVSLEHKLGIHASPTCVMSFGDEAECIGELVGRENEGLKAMFTMMNSARVNVGNEGVQIAERAYQQAARYASERVQSARAGSPDRTPVAIIEHPDVRRMLLRMRALTEGARALLYYTAGQLDRGTAGDKAAMRRGELLVPLLKAWGTDIGVEVASLGIQIHGGMGFIEETGAAQHLRDARIAPIYEGTNGIQAADFVTRKLGMEGGAVLATLMQEIAQDCAAEMPALAELARTCAALGEEMAAATIDDRLAGSYPFLDMAATAVAAWQLLRQSRWLDANAAGTPQAKAKQVVARYFESALVTEALGLAAQVRAGAALLYALDAEALAG